MGKKILDFIKKEIKPYNSLFTLFMYSIFSLIYTYPLVLYLNKYIIGDLEGDMWKHVWGFWWVKKRIFEDGVLPLFTSILNYPYGGSLFFIDPLGALWSIPLQSVLSVELAYNLLVLFNLTFGAFCAYLLANYFIKNKAAAFYSGAVYAFTAYMLAYITSGVSETFNIAWMPLFLYFFVRFLNENSEVYAILAGLTLFFVTMGSFYYGSFTTITGMFYFFYFAWQKYKKIVLSKKDGERKRDGIVERMNILSDNPDLSPAMATSSQMYRQIFQADASRRKPGSFIHSVLNPARGKAGKKVMGFRDWLLKIVSYVAIILIIVTLPLILYFLPSYMNSVNKSLVSFVGVAVTLILTLISSLVYVFWFYRQELKNFIYSLQGYFYSDNPVYVKRKMYFIFGMYAISILGFIHLLSVVRQDTTAAIFRVASLMTSSIIIALILTYLQFKGRESKWERMKKERKAKDKVETDSEGKATFLEYAQMIVPLFVLVLGVMNLLRIIVFYQEIEKVFGLANIMGNLAVSMLIVVASLIHIISSKIYMKWELFVNLYIDPEVKGPKKTPELVRKIVGRNIIISIILLLAISLPPVILFFRGFSPDRYMKAWFIFTLVVAVIGTILFYLSRESRKKDKKEIEDSDISRYFKVMFRGPIMKLVIMSIVALALIGPLFYAFKASLTVSGGLVKRERSIEFIDLYLSQRFHNISRLADYVTPGKENLTRTYTVDRLTRSSYAGWITLILVVTAVFISRRRKSLWFWVFCGVFFTMFSLGPYLYVSENIHTNFRFPVYIFFYKYFPFFNQISIPYRFNLCAMLAFGILAGYGLSSLFRLWNRKHQQMVVTILALAMLFEVCIISPAPYPMPLSDLTMPEFYKKMADDKQEYGIIDSPIQRIKGELLPGEYFYYQMEHRKGIPYKVEGTIPVYIYENQFTVYLFNLEKGYSVAPPKKELLKQYLDELKKNRFKYIVVHNEYLKLSARERVHTYLQYFLGEPEIRDEGKLHIYKIY